MMADRRIRLTVMWALLALLTALEVGDAAVMLRHGDMPGTITHMLLAVIFVVIAVPCFRRLFRTVEKNSSEPSSLTPEAGFRLVVANMVLLIIIAIHDFDHMRQAIEWGYHFTIPLLVVNFIVYVPGVLGMMLSSRLSAAGTAATTIAGPLIALAFLKVHLLGAWIPVWGPWNVPFADLGADRLSWGILWITAFVGIVVGLIGAYELGMSRARRLGVRLTDFDV